MARAETRMTDDLKALPQDMRESLRTADHKLARAASEKPMFAQALDLRPLLATAAFALVVAFLARIAGLGFVPSLLLFLVLFIGGWLALVRAAAPRRRTAPSSDAGDAGD